MSNPAQQTVLEAVRVREAQERARLAELELDTQLAAAIARFEVRTKQRFAAWAAEQLTSDAEHPVSESTVLDWIARRNGRRPPACLVKLLCREDEEFAAWWCTSTGYEPPKRRIDIPDKELVRRFCDLAPKRLGAAGEALVREILSAPLERSAPEWEASTPKIGMAR